MIQSKIMCNTHPEWDNFIEQLCEKLDEYTCGGDLACATKVLIDNYPECDRDLSIEMFKKKGGNCDCEILLNVYRPAPENIEPLLNELKYEL